MKKFLAALLSVILMLGIVAIYLPAREASAATYYSPKYIDLLAKTGKLPINFKLYYQIVKYPAVQVPSSKDTTPESPVKPTPKPETKPEPAPAPEGPKTNGESSLNQFELRVVELVNAERQKNGLKPLAIDEKLSQVARLKSADMRDNNYFSHQSSTYGSPFNMLNQFGISYRTASENIAAGQRTPEIVVQSWMNSSGHRANILNPNFTHIGVGFVQGGSYGTYWTQLFIGK